MEIIEIKLQDGSVYTVGEVYEIGEQSQECYEIRKFKYGYYVRFTGFTALSVNNPIYIKYANKKDKDVVQ
jgi:hypothetical protein